MSQYSAGSVAVTKGSATITGTSTAWLSNINIGDGFTVASSGITYDVAAIVSDTVITLSAPYVAATASNQYYAIIRDFTAVLGLPYPVQGDQETATVVKTALQKLDAGITVTSLTHRGDWIAATSYSVNDAVQSGGRYFVARTANTNSVPPATATNTTQWQLMADKGSALADRLAAEAAANAASTSANSASGSKTLAEASATQAAASATGASSSATAAANSSGAAQSSASAANASANSAAAIVTGDLVSTKSVISNKFGSPAVTATLPPITIIASDYFDNSQDSAWIDRCSDKSWELEARSGVILSSSNYANATAAVAAGIVTGDGYYNTTTAQFEEVTGATTSTITGRAGSRKFPMEVLATAEAGRIIIWDATSGQPEMWMVFTQAPSDAQTDFLNGANVTSVSISGHILCVGMKSLDAAYYGHLRVANFVADTMVIWQGYYGHHFISPDNISNRDGYIGFSPTSSGGIAGGIVDGRVNSVAITYLPDAPLDEYGMRVPTIAVGTAGGVSVIKHDGSVVNITATFVPSIHKVHFYADSLWFTQTDDTALYLLPVPSVSLSSAGYYSAITGIRFYYAGWYPALLGASVAKGLVRSATYSNLGLCLLHENPTTPANGMVAYLTNTYNTGWMVGDIRRAYLCNSLTADRSVKGGTLTVNGTVTETVNAGGVNVYSGFGATNYLSEASHADWNALGTGDFSIIMSGVKWGTAGAQRYLLSIGDGVSAGSLVWTLRTDNKSDIAIHNGTAWVNVTTTANAYNDSAVHSMVVCRRSGVVFVYVDGVEQSVTVLGSMAATITNSTGTLRIGTSTHAPLGWSGGQVALFRISATAPTPEQIKHIYETERKLFEPNAKGLLSSSPSVTDLKYNKQHDTYYVKNGANVDEFKGLQRTDSMTLATGVTTSGNPLAAPVLSSTGTTNIFKAPAVDMNSSIKALGLQLADAKQGTIIKTITSSATSVLTMPQGFKPIRITSATGTYVSLSTNVPKYDGFIWSITTGLAANTAYDVEMRRV